MKTTQIKKSMVHTALAISVLTGVGMAHAQMMGDSVMVGGQSMLPSKDIIDNAVKSVDHTTLVAAVKAAGLVDALKGAGPFTVFAPVNSAFAALPAGTVDNLLKPENKASLSKILTAHVVASKLDKNELMSKIKSGGGKTELNTLSGDKLWVMMNGNNLIVKDENGGVANISTYDVYQSNGVIQVVDRVLLPK